MWFDWEQRYVQLYGASWLCVRCLHHNVIQWSRKWKRPRFFNNCFWGRRSNRPLVGLCIWKRWNGSCVYCVRSVNSVAVASRRRWNVSHFMGCRNRHRATTYVLVEHNEKATTSFVTNWRVELSKTSKSRPLLDGIFLNISFDPPTKSMAWLSIKNWPTPLTKTTTIFTIKERRGFLGFFNSCRRYIKGHGIKITLAPRRAGAALRSKTAMVFSLDHPTFESWIDNYFQKDDDASPFFFAVLSNVKRRHKKACIQKRDFGCAPSLHHMNERHTIYNQPVKFRNHHQYIPVEFRK